MSHKKINIRITLACEDCHERNYSTFKNKQTKPERLALKKYCPRCSGHKIHKETR
jgi:large subunit ribosomal protein L33